MQRCGIEYRLLISENSLSAWVGFGRLGMGKPVSVTQWIDRIPAKQRPWAKGAAAIAAAIFLWQIGSWAFSHHQPPPDNSVPILVATAAVSDVPLYLEGLGTVRATNTVTVRSRVDGQLVEVRFREGQTVKKDDVLAQIDARPFQAMFDNAMGNLARDRATLENAKRDLVRYQELAKSGFATQQNIDTQAANVASLAATVRAGEGAARNAQVQLGYATIKAPIDGRTGIRQIDTGNIIHASDPNGLVVITQVQPIAVIFTLPQKDLARVIAAGDPTTLKVVALDTESTIQLAQGTLELIDNTFDTATGTVRLKATFPNAPQTLWPGQFVNVRLQTGTAHNAVTVPAQAVQRGAKGSFVYVVTAQNTVEMRVLETGQEQNGTIIVTKGLNANERVVTDGVLSITSGSKVRVADQKADAGNKDSTAAQGG